LVFDFRRGFAAAAVTVPGERGAVMDGAFTGNGLWVKYSRHDLPGSLKKNSVEGPYPTPPR
jgi:hypothetical protein